MPRISLITSVLDSREVVRRQLLYLANWLPEDCELIVVDDGSDPPLRDVCLSVDVRFSLTWCPTRDQRPWTSPRGRNLGARVAASDWLLLFDIDHIVTESLIAEALSFEGDMFHWQRHPGVLDEFGRLQRDHEALFEYGWDGKACGPSVNAFVVRRRIFETLEGYDERFCGKYGGDDIDFNERYLHLANAKRVKPPQLIGEAFVFPNPSADRKGLFHKLVRC